MELVNCIHAGEVIEKAVRRSGISITETGRRLHVTRRSLYNWFKKEELDRALIYQLGDAIGHDFSADFPTLYDKHFDYFKRLTQAKQTGEYRDDAEFWRLKYLSILKKYNDLLSGQSAAS